VTYARPVGTIPTGPIALHRKFRRAGVFAGAGVIAALNAQAGQIIDALRFVGVAEAITGLAGISAVIWIAMYAAMKVGFEDASRRLDIRDGIVLAAVLALSLIPISLAAKAALLICAVYLFATSRRGDSSHRVSLILLALTGPLIWGRILLHVFEAPILGFDARLVGGIIGSNVNGNIVRFADGNTSFLIGGPCSSVHNMSLAIVLWTTAAVVFRIRIDRRFVGIGAAMVGWMFALNIARLASIGLFPNRFDLLHEGLGATLFGWAGLIGAGLLAGVGVIRAAERQR
jgi:exosortase/archaeosortase family protein